MKKQHTCTALAAMVGMMVLIFDGKTALRGASDGISLCLHTLIPSLFPFFILSILLTTSISGQAYVFLNPIAKLCHIPSDSSFLLTIGILGGYPVGAQNVAAMYRFGQLSTQQASRMIVFCNNAGPAFIFGILGSMFSNAVIPWILWGIHIFSALVVGSILPYSGKEHTVSLPKCPITLVKALETSIKTMAMVCGWVVLMRMVLTFFQRWFLWLLPTWAQITIAGILELSNGCIQLIQINCEGLRFLLASVFLSLGGVCVTLQTLSVADGIPMKLYFPGKILQCCISVTMCCLLQFLFPVPQRYASVVIFSAAVIVGIFLILFLRHTKNNSRIPVYLGV